MLSKQAGHQNRQQQKFSKTKRSATMEEMENVMNNLTKAIDQNLSDLLKARDLNERKLLADIVKSLCESMGVFFNAMEMESMGFYGDDEEGGITF